MLLFVGDRGELYFSLNQERGRQGAGSTLAFKTLDKASL